MEKGVFRFKQFSCQHYGSSMRIGVDAVLLGAWAKVDGGRVLDVGTGCGVIALMCAQRNTDAIIDAIDTDAASVEEASTNFTASPWADRLHVFHENYLNFKPAYRYDRIVSNPPYFNSGVDSEVSVRMHARHEGDLSPMTLLLHSRELLSPTGTVSMIVPYLRADEIIADAASAGFTLICRLDVRGNASAPLKRSLLEFSLKYYCENICSGNNSNLYKEDLLTLEISSTVPTADYKNLCKEFYLYF